MKLENVKAWLLVNWDTFAGRWIVYDTFNGNSAYGYLDTINRILGVWRMKNSDDTFHVLAVTRDTIWHRSFVVTNKSFGYDLRELPANEFNLIVPEMNETMKEWASGCLSIKGAAPTNYAHIVD